MTLSTTTSRASFAGNDVTTVFSFPYYFLAAGDLKVYIRNNSTGAETLKTITTHYTVSGAGEAAGGSVTMLTAPATGETLVIYRDPAITQGVDLVENDSAPAETQEMAHDRAAMIAQRLKDRVDRAVRLPDAFSPTFDPTLPVDLDGAGGKVPLINDDGNGFAAAADWPSADDIADAEENAAAAAASATDAETAQAAAEDAQAAAETAQAAAEAALAAMEGGLADGSVTTVKIDDEAVTTDKIATGAVTRPKLAAEAIARSAVAAKTANYTLTDDDDIVLGDATGGTFTLTLPTAVGKKGRIYELKKTDASANAISIATTSAQTMDGSTTDALNYQYETRRVISDGANWIVAGAKPALSGRRQYSLTVALGAFGVSWTTRRAIGVPYQTDDGAWRIVLEIDGTSDNNTPLGVAVTGITFKTIASGQGQAMACFGNSSSGCTAIAQSGANTIKMLGNANNTQWSMSGDVELDSKPSFVP